MLSNFLLSHTEMDDKDDAKAVELKLMEAKGKDNVVIENLDDALPYVGELGKYQIILISIMALATLVAGFPVLIMFFAGQNPPWQCETNSTICKLNGTFKSGAKNYEARCSMPRSEWKFTKPIDYSIVTQVRWKYKKCKKLIDIISSSNNRIFILYISAKLLPLLSNF